MQAADAARATDENAGASLVGAQEEGAASGAPTNIFEFAPGADRSKISTFDDDPDGSLEIERQRMIYQDSPEWRINQAGTGKVVKLVTRDQEQVERLYFKNPREKFEYFRREQRGRELTADEIRWLQTFVDDWFDVADMFSEQWPEGDRAWLGKIAPDHFPQYAMSEEEHR